MFLVVADTVTPIHVQMSWDTLLNSFCRVECVPQEAEAKRADAEKGGDSAADAESRREEWQNQMQQGLLTVRGLEFDKKWIRLLRVIKTQVCQRALLTVSAGGEVRAPYFAALRVAPTRTYLFSGGVCLWSQCFSSLVAACAFAASKHFGRQGGTRGRRNLPCGRS